MDADARLTARRLLYTANARAGDVAGPVALAVGGILAAWERLIGFDSQPHYEGPRNLWGEPAAAGARHGLSDVSGGWQTVGR